MHNRPEYVAIWLGALKVQLLWRISLLSFPFSPCLIPVFFFLSPRLTRVRVRVFWSTDWSSCGFDQFQPQNGLSRPLHQGELFWPSSLVLSPLSLSLSLSLSPFSLSFSFFLSPFLSLLFVLSFFLLFFLSLCFCLCLSVSLLFFLVLFWLSGVVSR